MSPEPSVPGLTRFDHLCYPAGAMSESHPLQRALTLPGGARFHRIAFQVNPHAYLVRHSKVTTFSDEVSYNEALIEALIAEGVTCIAVTDHFRIRYSIRLMNLARSKGIAVFPGFEANSRDGVHLLCLFGPDTPPETVQARIHLCGVHEETTPSPLGTLSAAEILFKCVEWKMQCIAPHVTLANGILTCLAGQARIALWRHECLAACAIPGGIADLPIQFRPIIRNDDPNYRRDHRVSVVNAGDVDDPAAVSKPSSSCFVKMTTPSLEGLRQAFLDPDSRVRLVSDGRPEEHAEFLSMTWETAGFLQGLRLRFNENLNVIIGGRGTGKSTVIESLRYVLGLAPIGKDARAAHDAAVRGVLVSGTRVSLLVQTFKPDSRRFIIERTVGNPPIVRDEATGNVLSIKPSDLLPNLTILGQNEVAELARDPLYLTELLRRFTGADDGMEAQRRALSVNMERSHRDILECTEEEKRIDEQLAALPGIEETLRRYRDAGVEEKLGHRSLIVKEEGILVTLSEKLTEFADACSEVERLQPLQLQELNAENIAGLPSGEGLTALRVDLERFNVDAASAMAALQGILTRARTALGTADTAVGRSRTSAQGDYERLLRELQAQHIDGADFVALRASVERLRPLQERRRVLATRMQGAQQRRRNDLVEWEELKRKNLERLQRTASRLNTELRDLLRVTVVATGDKTPVLDAVKSVGGRVSETLAALSAMPDLSVAALAQAVREGERALSAAFGIPPAQAQRIAAGGEDLAMRIEELELPPGTDIQLNIAREGQPAEWRSLAALSVGQKATAILYLLLIETDAPLVIDQPEDNLDNRFISDGIVPKVKAEKQRRQFIFASHNANLPVLGDAEQIIALQTTSTPDGLRIVAASEFMGAIDHPPVRSAVEEILEGGKDAFTTRRRKYGF